MKHKTQINKLKRTNKELERKIEIQNAVKVIEIYKADLVIFLVTFFVLLNNIIIYWGIDGLSIYHYVLMFTPITALILGNYLLKVLTKRENEEI